MAAIYGHRWVSSYGDDPRSMTGDTWAAGLAGLTGEQLARGLEACIATSEPWPPTLPEFRVLCFDIPNRQAIGREITAYLSWRPTLNVDDQATAPCISRFTRLVLQFLPAHQYRHESAKVADRLLDSAYAEAREHVVRGGELPEEPAAVIGEPERREKTPEERERDRAAAQKAIAEMREMFAREEREQAERAAAEEAARQNPPTYVDGRAAAAGPDA